MSERFEEIQVLDFGKKDKDKKTKTKVKVERICMIIQRKSKLRKLKSPLRSSIMRRDTSSYWSERLNYSTKTIQS